MSTASTISGTLGVAFGAAAFFSTTPGGSYFNPLGIPAGQMAAASAVLLAATVGMFASESVEKPTRKGK